MFNFNTHCVEHPIEICDLVTASNAIFITVFKTYAVAARWLTLFGLDEQAHARPSPRPANGAVHLTHSSLRLVHKVE